MREKRKFKYYGCTNRKTFNNFKMFDELYDFLENTCEIDSSYITDYLNNSSQVIEEWFRGNWTCDKNLKLYMERLVEKYYDRSFELNYLIIKYEDGEYSIITNDLDKLSRTNYDIKNTIENIDKDNVLANFVNNSYFDIVFVRTFNKNNNKSIINEDYYLNRPTSSLSFNISNEKDYLSRLKEIENIFQTQYKDEYGSKNNTKNQYTVFEGTDKEFTGTLQDICNKFDLKGNKLIESMINSKIRAN